AAKAGAEVRRGLSVIAVEPGLPASVRIQTNSGVEKLTARLIVGADGRGSALRRWAGFAERRDPDALMIVGVCLEGMSNVRDDATYFYLNPDLAEASFVVTTGPGTARAYVGYRAERGYRWNGPEALPQFIEESVRCGLPAEFYLKAQPAGPLATFNCADSWIDYPYANGIALIGDAAASSNPDWGQGLSLTLRDARVLRDALLPDDDWDRAGRAYAATHDRYYSAVHNYEKVLTDFFYGTTEIDRARRAKALPLIAEDVTRVPDNLNCGPDLPLDEAVLRRFYGEQ
ncbi:MAG TPA: FAD-dependent monooxygenase, partial [Candidatus Binataceae bacterium]|nr:FAD-dependent monooxygenase [Candidatus Binataceae bacterium]